MFDPYTLLQENCGGCLSILLKLTKLAKFTWDDSMIAEMDHDDLCLYLHHIKAAFGWFGCTDAQSTATKTYIDVKTNNNVQAIQNLREHVMLMHAEVVALITNIDTEMAEHPNA